MNRSLPPPSGPDRPPLGESELELAALYALSALSAAEREACERDQRDRPEFWAEVRSLRAAAAGVAESGPRARPRRDLWPEIRARLAWPGAGRSQPWKDWIDDAPSAGAVVPADDAGFEPTDVPGVSVRRLAVDAAADRVTMLVRMQPGSAYPAHRHGGPEECYVLAGDLRVGDGVELRAGDFQRMERESVHAVQSTRGGCVLLITSSRHDEILT